MHPLPLPRAFSLLFLSVSVFGGGMGCEDKDADSTTAVEICGDGIDNDENALTDCEDGACASLAECQDGDSADTAGDTGDTGDTTVAWPALVLNEFMASNSSTIADASGAWPDWIELYNPTDAAVSLGGWSLTDDLLIPDKHVLDASLSVPAGGFLLLWADNDLDEGAAHIDFKLSADGEQLGLFAPDGTALDSLEFGPQLTDLSTARQPDGAATWIVTDAPTPGESNGTAR